MGQTVKLRRSAVSGRVPINSQLQLGELSVNTADGKLFFAKSGSLGPSIEEIITTNTQNTGSIDLVGALTASVVSASFIGDGSELYNIPSSGVTGLSLDRITSGGAVASIREEQFDINVNTEINGSLTVTEITGSGLGLTNVPVNISGSSHTSTNYDGLFTKFHFDDSTGIKIVGDSTTGVAKIYLDGVASEGGGGEGSTKLLSVATPSSVWTFNHGLGEQYPSIMVFDNNNNVIIPQNVEGVSTTQLVVTFASPQTGYVTATVGGGLPSTDVSDNKTLVSESGVATWKNGILSGSVSFNSFSSSIDDIVGSLNLYTSSNDDRVDSIESQTGSYLVDSDLSTLEGQVSSLETSTSSLNSFTSSINTTIKDKLNTDGVVSGSIQIDHDSTRNFVTNEHIDHSTITIGSGKGLSGGGTIDVSRSITLDTGSVHFVGGVKTKLNSENVVSGSIQVDITGTTNYNLVDGRLDSLEIESGSIRSTVNTYTSSNDGRVSDLESFETTVGGGLEFTGSNVTIKGDLLVKGTETRVNSTTVEISDNVISLNGSGAANGGIEVRDVTSPGILSGSLIWDGTENKWKGGSKGSEDGFILEGDYNTYTSSNNTTNTNQDGRLDSIESVTGSYLTSYNDEYTTGATFNSTNGVVTFTRNDGDVFTVDIDGRYLTSFTETDPIFNASPSAGITDTNIENWDTAYTYSQVGHLPLSGGTITGPTLHGDGVHSYWGASNDLQIDHDGNHSVLNNLTGHLYISNEFDDGDIVFRSDDGLGGVTEYFRLDGGIKRNVFSQNVGHEDNVRSIFGSGNDLQIYHDGSNSYITDSGLGNLRIRSTSLRLEGTGSQNMAVLNEGGDVSLYYNAVKKFNTTNTGILVSGTIVATGYNDTNWDTAYGWGDHSQVGYITGFTNTNEFTTGATFNSSDGIITFTRNNGGDTYTVDLDGRYLTSFTETDPIFTASPSAGITDINITNWDEAYGWGDHSTVGYLTSYNNEYTTGATFNNTNGVITFTRNDGDTFSVDVDGRYLTSFTETDPIFMASPSAGITDTNIENWDTAYGWGDHSTEGYLTTYNNHYTTGATFNTGNGIITGTRNDGGTWTVDIDGKYSELNHNHDTQYLENSYVDVDMDTYDGDKSLLLGRNQSSWSSGTKPSGAHNGFGILHVTTHVGGYATQFGFDTNQNKMWVRSKNPTTWGSWKYMWTEQDFTSSNVTNWNTAYGWGDHSTVGYLTSYNDEYTTGATFNGGNGIITFTRNDGDQYTVDISSTLTDVTVTGGTYNDGTQTLTLTKSDGNSVNVTGFAIESVKFTTGATFNSGNGIITFNNNDATTYTVDIDNRYLQLGGGTLTGNLTLNSVNPEILFNGTSDVGVDMAIKATPEGLDFYEPEDGNKIHFQILDDTGVNAVFGLQIGGTQVLSSSRVLTNVTGNISMFTNDNNYLTSFTETDPIFTASPSAGITDINITNWDTAYGWGDHSTEGYLTSFTETDPIYTSERNSLRLNKMVQSTLLFSVLEDYNKPSGYSTMIQPSSYQNPLPSHGYYHILGRRDGGGGYGALLQSYNSDELFHGNTTSNTTNIVWRKIWTDTNFTQSEINNWGTAYGWGDHSTEGYLTSFTETDPIFTASPSAGITDINITNWDAAYGWGDHSQSGYITGFTNTNEFTTGATFNSGNGVITFTRNNGGDTFTVDIDGRYAPTVHNHKFLLGSTANEGGGGMQNWNSQESTPDLNPTTDWYTSLRIGHGDPVAYYSNTLAMSMTGGDTGRIHVRTNGNGTYGTWKKYWHDGDFTSTNISNWNTAYGWGDHSGVYLPIAGKAADSNLLDGLDLHTGRNNEVNKVVRTDANGYIQAGWINTTSGDNGTTGINRIYASQDGYIRYYTPSNFISGLGLVTTSGYNNTNWDTAYGWGDHSQVGYITGFTNTNEFTTGATFNSGDGVITFTRNNGGDTFTVDLDGRYLTSFTETDPIFTASPSAGITDINIENWNTAYGWGDHDGVYLPIGGGTLTGDLIVGSIGKTSNSVVKVLAEQGYKAGFEAYGNGQGTGYIYVGQSTTHGGGMSYNGDSNPALVSGETDDRITFYRRTNSVDSEVFSYNHSSDSVYFNGEILPSTINTGQGSTEVHLMNQNIRTTDDVQFGKGKFSEQVSVNNRTAMSVAHWSRSGNTTGAIKIKVPGTHTGNWSMFVLRITTYEYNSNAHAVYYVSGHDWTSGWYSNGVTVQGTGKLMSLGFSTAENEDYVILGDTDSTWAYGHVTVDVVAHPDFYNSSMDITSGWVITQETELDGITINSVTNKQLLDTSTFGTKISQWDTAYGWGNHADEDYATETYVGTQISNLVDSAPGTLDTLNELAAALGDDANFATTITNSIATKVPLTGNATITGTKFFSTNLSNEEDWINSPISVTERDSIGNGSTDDKYSPNINFHWSSQVSRSLWMSSNGDFHFGEYSATGVPTNSGNIHVSGGNSSQWNTAYGWGDHNGVYLPIGGKAVDSELLDGIDSGTFMRRDTNVTLATGSKFTFHSGGGGTTFGNNHYSMGVDIANGGWTNPNYSDLIIGYHTGIRIGAAYGGTRFYSNSPTTDTDNTGNGNGNESLIMTVGGAAGSTNVSVVGNIVSSNFSGSSSGTNTGDQDLSGYLTTSGKAADSELLDGINSTSFLRSDVADSATNLTVDTLTIGSSAKIQFQNNDYIRYDDANGVGRFHFDSDGGTNNASVQAATFVGALEGNASTASFATDAKWISFPDGPRNLTDRLPNWNNRSVAWDFVGAGTASGTGNYAGVMTFSPWDGTASSTGDSSYQLAFVNLDGVNASGTPGLRLRNGIDTTWNDWVTLFHTGNFTDNSTNWNTAYGWGNHSGLYLPISGKAADSELLDGINSTSFLRSDVADTFTATITMGTQQAFKPDNFGQGVYGRYNSSRYQHLWGMGDSWHMAEDGTALGNFYGLAYTHTNVGGESKSGLSHQTLFVENGVTKTAIGSGIWTDGTITTTNHGTSEKWSDAYEWGNHASGGYLTSSSSLNASNINSGTYGDYFSPSTRYNIGLIDGNSSQSRDKLRVWDSGTYSIGMKDGYSYGHLGGVSTDYAMSFQMSNNNTRGFWWGDASHNDSQGSMSLTTDGNLVVATSISIGQGETITAPSTTPLYVEGTTAGETVFEVHGTSGQLFSITDSLIGDLFEISDVSGIPILTVNSSGVVTVDDTLHVNGDVIAYYASDERLKDNIKPILNPLDKLKLIGGYEFDWNSNSKNNKGHDVGVIAQEIELVLPELVGTRSDGYKGVKYEKLTALLIEANKELLKRVEELESKLKK